MSTADMLDTHDIFGLFGTDLEGDVLSRVDFYQAWFIHALSLTDVAVFYRATTQEITAAAVLSTMVD